MRYYMIDIFNITYRVVNHVTQELPTSFKNVCVEMNPDELDLMDEKKTDFLFRQAAGMFIINTTGYTPENFNFEIKPL